MWQLIDKVLRNSDLVCFSQFAWLPAGCADNEKVIDVITSPSNEVPSPKVGLLDKIALALDGTSLVVSNWYTLALNLGVPRKTCWNFETIDRKSDRQNVPVFGYQLPKKDTFKSKGSSGFY